MELKFYSIARRGTHEELFRGQFPAFPAALEAAVKGGANLGGADLGDANLGGADLGGANLRGADLRDANLGDANLGGADLRDANLGGANLRDANLGGANLRGADLGGANLRGANLRDANLRDANLGDANLRDADLGGANLGGANLRGADLGGADLGDANLRDAPVIPDFDERIEEATRPDGALVMSSWHCETTHCRAGWAITLAGDEGRKLEEALGPSVAGALIYARNSAGPVPDFYASNDEARADIVRRAEAARAAKVAQ